MKFFKIVLAGVLGAYFLYGCDDILVEDISEEAVAVIAPVDGSVLSDQEVNFSWNPLDGATEYHLQVVYPDFENAKKLVLDTVVAETNFTEALALGEYEWRLKGINNYYETAWLYQRFTLTSQGE